MEKVGTNTATVSWERNGVMPDKYVLVQRNEYSESKIIIEGDQTTDEKKERVFSKPSLQVCYYCSGSELIILFGIILSKALSKVVTKLKHLFYGLKYQLTLYRLIDFLRIIRYLKFSSAKEKQRSPSTKLEFETWPKLKDPTNLTVNYTTPAGALL